MKPSTSSCLARREPASPRRFANFSARPLRVVLTRRRAVALGLARREDLSGAVSISLAPELPAVVIRNLADPAASLGADPPGLGPEPMIAEGAELAAVALAKLAALSMLPCPSHIAFRG